MSDVVAPAGAIATGARQLQLNPERVPALVAKWQKLLGKELEEIQVTYTADGIDVSLTPVKNGPAFSEKADGTTRVVSVAAFKAAKSEKAKPSQEEAKVAFRNKFELRLNKPFPTNGDLGDGSDAAIQTFLQGLDFADRRFMLMSNKQFKTAAPNGPGQVQA
jgi:hypothetical protein